MLFEATNKERLLPGGHGSGHFDHCSQQKRGEGTTGKKKEGEGTEFTASEEGLLFASDRRRKRGRVQF